jgi:hypothetical protein
MTHSTTTLPTDEKSPTSPAPAPRWGDPATPPGPRQPSWARRNPETVVHGGASARVKDAANKPKARSAPKWETEARDRLKAAIRRYSKPLADLVARDANEGDTRLLVTDFLCDGLGFDKYADLTTEYQVKGEFADYGVRIDRELVAFIEVKRVATKLSTRHLRQVEMYAVDEGSSGSS